MKSQIFGTDGVRGRANTHPMTAETAMRLGQSAGRLFSHGARRTSAVLGKDTRLSGYMLESALVAGLCSVGTDVILTGPVPTPAVGMLTRSLRADFGIMISASHNPAEDNGIKFFGPDGYKLSDAEEDGIERLLTVGPRLSEPLDIGRATRIEGAAERYMEFAKAGFPKGLRLDGLRIVVDAANGAAYRTAPSVIWELGAEVVRIGTEPDGLNINAGCGSTDVAACVHAVLETGADLGIALDGDADRVQLIDECGGLIDGDQLMALIAERHAAAGTLRGGAVVATIMSNLGLERHLAGLGIELVRTKVGDRYVVEKMRELGCNVGGEQSGHIILSEHTTTGDGLIAALQALAAISEERRPASQTLRRFAPVPQVLRNIRVGRGAGALLEDPAVRGAVAAAEARLNGSGRLLLRPSGTEPLIRLMVEGPDDQVIDTMAEDICSTVTEAAAQESRRRSVSWADDIIAESLP